MNNNVDLPISTKSTFFLCLWFSKQHVVQLKLLIVRSKLEKVIIKSREIEGGRIG